jgi:acetyltransferase
VGGVKLNVNSTDEVIFEMERMMDIKDATGILFQPMLSGIELFAGVKKEDAFGHMILFGLGGIFIEVLKDVKTVLAPASKEEILREMKQLTSYKIIEGVRGQEGVNEEKFADIVSRLSALVQIAPEIFEMDLNPLLGTADNVVAVDARIRIEK